MVDNINFIFCSDKYLLNINREYLKHNTYTDIITFNYADEEDAIEAELYISVTRVADNAQILGVSFEQELRRVIIHGVLHLCGYEDNTKDLKHEMQVAENKYINLIVSRETKWEVKGSHV